VLIELARLNGQRIDPAPDGTAIQTPLDWKPWNKLRSPIEERRRDFVNVARDHLAPGTPLQRLMGRPADDDPFWRLRRSYFSSDGSQPDEAPL
jgi:hypothetical protein